MTGCDSAPQLDLACERLYRRHQATLVAVARRRGCDEHEAWDVVQEVFLRVFRSLPRFESRMPFAHWLAVIARNTCAKLRRHWCHRHKLSAGFEDGALELLDETPSTQTAPDDRRRTTYCDGFVRARPATGPRPTAAPRVRSACRGSGFRLE